MFLVVHFFPTFITIGDIAAMGINTVDPKVVLGREVFPTGRAESLSMLSDEKETNYHIPVLVCIY